jgi:hypothetical protein
MKITHTALKLCILLSPIFCGCVNEFDGEDGVVLHAADKTNLLFSITVPQNSGSRPHGQGSVSSGTRAIGETEENAVTQVDVLAYRYDATDQRYYYAYHAVGEDIADGSNTAEKTFSLAARTLGDRQKFVVIANAHAEVQALVNATSKQGSVHMDAMLQRLQFRQGDTPWTANTADEFTRFPMWGESLDSIRVTSETHALDTPIPLLRTLARIDVVLSTNTTGDADTTPADVFRLTSVRLYNYQQQANIVPARTHLQRQETGAYHTVTAATIPTNSSTATPHEAVKGPLLYGEDDAGNRVDAHFNGLNIEGTIYTFETKAPSFTDNLKATCLVVGGIYDANRDGLFDEAPSYYRLDFADNTATGTAGGAARFIDILRNHKYVANIVAVKGPGYADPETAFDSKSLNIVADIMGWDDRLQDIVFDKDAYLAVSRRSFRFYKEESSSSPNADNTLTVGSNYLAAADRPSGWNILTNSGASWLDLYDGDTRIAAYPTAYHTTPRTLHFRFAANPGTTDRTAVITFAAGQLRYDVTFTQSAGPNSAIRFYNSEGEEITDGIVTFTAKSNVQPASQTIRVEWAPATSPATVSIAGSHPVRGNGLPLAAGLIGGSKLYNIEPDVIAHDDPRRFEGYETRVTFTVGNGAEGITRTLILRQVNHALDFATEADAAKDGDIYLMDHATHTFSLTTNFPYLVEKTDADDPMLNAFTGGTAVGGSYDAVQTNAVSFTFHDYRTRYEAGLVDPHLLPQEMNVRIWRTDEQGQKLEMYGIYPLQGTPIKIETARRTHEFTVPASGGASDAFEIKGVDTYHLKAKIVITSGEGGSGKRVVNHRPHIILIDADGTERENNTYDAQGFVTEEITAADDFRVKWDRIYYPNREIPHIQAQVQLYLHHAATDALFKIPGATFTVKQQMLTARRRAAWSVFSSTQGALQFNYNGTQYPITARMDTIVSGSTAQRTPRDSIHFPYIHLTTNGTSSTLPTDADLRQINDSLEAYLRNEAVLTVVGRIAVGGSATVANRISNLLLPGNYQLAYSTSTGVGNIPFTTDHATSKVYQFLMGTHPHALRPVTPAAASFFSGFSSHYELTSYPSSTIPIAYYGNISANRVVLAVDPAARLVFVSDIQMFYDAYTSPGYPRNRLYYNLIDYLTLTADYGAGFSDMLVDGLLPDGTPAPDPPWHTSGGGNAYPN